MIIIIGLGNPGEQFKKTRHNLGRELVEEFAKKSGFSDFRFEKKYNAETSEGKIGKEKVVLACPNTFMNKSGSAVGPLAKFFKIKPENIFLVHDDTDLPFGSTKLSFGKHSAGHKGVESVIKSLKTLDFWRVRLGIGNRQDTPAEKMVLKKLTPKDQTVVRKINKKTMTALETIIAEGPEKAMNFYNQN